MIGSSQPAWRRPASVVLWLLPPLLIAGSMGFSSRILRERSPEAGAADLPRGVLLLEISRHPAFAFGFRNVLGDLVWLQAVQVSGSRKLTAVDYDRLSLLLRTVGNFDPRFAVPYLLGGILLADSPAHVRDAMEILQRGWDTHRDDWRFPFYLGYTRYFAVGDPVEGARALEAASGIPGSPPYLPLLAARMYSEGRAPETALAFLEGMVRQETDPSRLEILHRRIREVIVERDLQALERAVAAYRGGTGALPERLSDLVRGGWIRTLPEEPNGGSYLLSPDGTVRSDRVATRLKVFRKR